MCSTVAAFGANVVVIVSKSIIRWPNCILVINERKFFETLKIVVVIIDLLAAKCKFKISLKFQNSFAGSQA